MEEKENQVSNNLTHWKKEKNPNYLGSWDLAIGEDEDGNTIYGELALTIKSIEKAQVTDMEQVRKGKLNATKEETVVYFEENVKPFILHATCNYESLEKACKSKFVEKWVGKRVMFYVDKNVKAFGKTTEALRIKPIGVCCDVCKKLLTADTYTKSINKYGKPYCSKECMEKGTKGKDLL